MNGIYDFLRQLHQQQQPQRPPNWMEMMRQRFQNSGAQPQMPQHMIEMLRQRFQNQGQSPVPPAANPVPPQGMPAPLQQYHQQMTDWRGTRPVMPEGNGLSDPAAREAFRTQMSDWRGVRPDNPFKGPGNKPIR